MTRHVVIGTAGHVDHGKTALVKALTGVETDRFPEEQRRGITIDIGFAPLALGDMHASVVDVPGHEDFIRNMVAGATGIDVALLVVAADEGVMPQTHEHLAILEALGIRHGVAAITKADLAEPDWLALVAADVAERLRHTSLIWSPPVAVSARSGVGLDALRKALANAATQVADRPADDLFRMPVDRVFSLRGAGTVVTGTTWSGSVKVGDQVTVLPEGIVARVRTVQVHGEDRPAAEPGRRTAVALAGVERLEVARGSVLVADPSWRATSAIDVRLTLLPGAPRPVGQRSRIRLHLGTAEVIARVTPAGEGIPPGESGVVRLRLESPVVARAGDRGVIRSYSPVTTIGACEVLDPWPAARPRRPVAADPGACPARSEGREPGVRVLVGASGLPVGDLPVRAGVRPRDLGALVGRLTASGDFTLAGDLIFPAAEVRRLSALALETLAADHRANPLAPGMPLELLRRALKPVTLAEYVLARLEGEVKIVVNGSVARLRSHAPTLDDSQAEAGRQLLEFLAAGGAEGRSAEEIQKLAKGTPALLDHYLRQGTAIRVGQERYYERAALQHLSRTALARIRQGGSAGSPSGLREVLKLSRKYLIPLLEWLDSKGFTVRIGDGRRVTPAGEKYLKEEA